MVVLNKIYTKKGDKGSTELGNGERVKKFSKRVTAYGTIDELNSVIGIVTSLDIDKDLKNSNLQMFGSTIFVLQLVGCFVFIFIPICYVFTNYFVKIFN